MSSLMRRNLVLRVWTFALALLLSPHVSWAEKAKEKAEEADELETETDEDKIKSDEIPTNEIYVNGYLGVAVQQIADNGLLGLAFNLGYKFDPQWSAGICATSSPEAPTPSTGRAARPVFLCAEGDYHLSKWVPGLHTGLKLGGTTFDNDHGWGIAAKAGYEYPIGSIFYVGTELSYMLSSRARGGNTFFALIGFGVKKDPIH